MSDLTPLHEALLELGLEDLIPLPEVFHTPEVRPLVEGGPAVRLVSRALLDLLARGRIQVWSGQWWEDPHLASRVDAEKLLLDERRYSFDLEQTGLERVYFVNVANYHVD